MSLLLTSLQLAAGTASLTSGKLSSSQVADLVSICRGYLGDLAEGYSLESTFSAEDDTDGLGAQRCGKLAACLALFQENQFTPESGFAATNANRTGFNYSLDGEVFETFKYAFGLFWDLPKELFNRFNRSGGQRTAIQGNIVTPGSLNRHGIHRFGRGY